MLRSAAGFAAAFAMLTSAQAQAAEGPAKSCMTRPELRAMVAYMLPSTIGAVIEKCRPVLAGSSATLTRGSQIVSELQAGQSAAFPLARQAFAKFSSAGDKAGAELFLAMPEETLKPVIEGIFTRKLLADMKTSNCPDIDRVFATLQPLPATNYVELITEVLSIAARNDKSLPVCTS